MKTYSELQALAKAAIRKIQNTNPDVGAVVITWNRGQKKTNVAIFTHANGDERPVVMHILRCAADQIQTTETVEQQGMLVTPGGIVAPSERSRIIKPVGGGRWE